jgi:hypothetical protein
MTHTYYPRIMGGLIAVLTVRLRIACSAELTISAAYSTAVIMFPPLSFVCAAMAAVAIATDGRYAGYTTHAQDDLVTGGMGKARVWMSISGAGWFW